MLSLQKCGVFKDSCDVFSNNDKIVKLYTWALYLKELKTYNWSWRKTNKIVHKQLQNWTLVQYYIFSRFYWLEMCGLVTCRQTTRSCTRKGENESKKMPFEMEAAQTYILPTLLTLLPLPTLALLALLTLPSLVHFLHCWHWGSSKLFWDYTGLFGHLNEAFQGDLIMNSWFGYMDGTADEEFGKCFTSARFPTL